MKIVTKNYNFIIGMLCLGIAVANTILAVSLGVDLSFPTKANYLLAALNFAMWIINRRYGSNR